MEKTYITLAQLYAALCKDIHLNQGLNVFQTILQNSEDVNLTAPASIFLTNFKPHLIGHTVLHFAIEKSYKKMLPCWEFKGKLYHQLADFFLDTQVHSGIGTNPRNKYGISHFHIACMLNNTKAVEFFLNNGASANEAVNEDSLFLPGFTPLHFAARYCSLETAEILLRYNANENIKDSKGMTPLQIIVERNIQIYDYLGYKNVEIYDILKSELKINTDVIKLLLKNCSTNNWNATDEIGLSHFHVVCMMQDISLVENYIQKGVDISHSIKYSSTIWPGYTAIHFAAYSSFRIVKLLVDNGADILACDNNGLTPLHLCFKKFFFGNATFYITQPVIKSIILSDGKTNLCDFIFALSNEKKMRIFLQNVNVNVTIPLDAIFCAGFTFLHMIVLIAPTEIDDILDPLASIDFSTKYSCMYTTHCKTDFDANKDWACKRIRLCSNFKANFAAQDNEGSTPIHLAFEMQKLKVLNFLLEKLYVQDNVDNIFNSKGLSILHIATAVGNHDVISKLISTGTDVNSTVQSSFSFVNASKQYFINSGSTSLHIAVLTDNLEITKLLLEKRASINIEDANGFTPVHLLLVHQNEKMSKLILFSPTRIVTTADGLCNLHVATIMNEETVIQFLLAHGANIEASIKPHIERNSIKVEETASIHKVISTSKIVDLMCSHPGFKSLHFAVKYRKQEACLELLRHGANVLANSEFSAVPLVEILLSKPLRERISPTARTNNYNIPEYKPRIFGNKVVSSILQILRNGKMQKRVLKETGLTMLHIACATLSVDSVRKSLNGGVKVNANLSVWPHCTALHLLMTKLDYQCDDKISEIFHLLMESGANIASLDANRATPIHKIFGYLKTTIGRKTAKLLLRAYADFDNNLTDNRGISLFHIACAVDEVEVVEKFLKHGVDINVPTDPFNSHFGGSMPLHLAVDFGALRTAQLLLDHKADVNAADSTGSTPLLLLTNKLCGLDLSEILKLIQPFNKAGADIYTENFYGKAFLIETARNIIDSSVNSLHNFAETLACNGYNVNIFDPNGNGYLALDVAQEYFVGGTEYVYKPYYKYRYTLNDFLYKVLINTLSNDMSDDTDCSLFHNIVSVSRVFISTEKYAEAVERLTKIEFDIDHQNNEGQTALFTAIRFGNRAGAIALLMNGADINVTDVKNKSVFDYKRNKNMKEQCADADSYVREALLQHLYKLHIFGLDIHVVIDAGEYLNKFLADYCVNQRCLVEVEDLKKRNIDPYSITLYDFLSERKLVAAYPFMAGIQRQAIDVYFQQNSGLLLEKYSELCGLLKLQYRKAVARVDFIEDAVKSVNFIAGFILPLPCLELILSFLSNSDLKTLIISTS